MLIGRAAGSVSDRSTGCNTKTQLVSSADPAIIQPSSSVLTRPATVWAPTGSTSIPAAASGTAQRYPTSASHDDWSVVPCTASYHVHAMCPRLQERTDAPTSTQKARTLPAAYFEARQHATPASSGTIESPTSETAFESFGSLLPATRAAAQTAAIAGTPNRQACRSTRRAPQGFIHFDIGPTAGYLNRPS